MSVGVVILTKGKVPMLIECLQSIKDNTNVPYSVYIGDTGSSRDELHEMIDYIKREFDQRNIHLHSFNRYNFAKCNNHIINNFVTEEYVVLCNNDIVLHNNCIDIMYNYITTHDNVGTVGCRLQYPQSELIQHAGQLVSINRNNASGRGYLAATHRGLKTTKRYKQWEPVVGNTGGFLMVEKSVYKYVGGLNENYRECFEDVEFNLRMIQKGKQNMYTDDAVCTHHESLTRGKKGMNRDMLMDHSNNLTPFFNSLDIDTKNKILNISKNSDL